MRRTLSAAVLAGVLALVLPSASPLQGQSVAELDAIAAQLEEQVIAWRRDFHENPELGNREFRTAEIVANHLRSLGMEVTTGVAHTGVVGILRGGRPGPTILLRADMDALPVEERNDLPFRSRATAEYNGETVPVMHACGHDTHVAIMMGVAEAMAAMRDELPGTVKFVFQPAEEGPPEGEEGGAELMRKEGVLTAPDVDAAFALHINAEVDVGTVTYRPGPAMASVQDYRIVVKGRQSHGAAPWMSVDPVVTGSQIVMGLQTIVARNLNITELPAIVTVGKFTAGVRSNIIPEEAELVGTIRTFSAEQKELVHRRIREIAGNIAESAGAEVEITIPLTSDYPVTYNDPALTERAVASIARVAGSERVMEVPLETGAEDFAFFAEEVPSFYWFLGGKPAGAPPTSHHTPEFVIDESGLSLGVKTMLAVALDYLNTGKPVTQD
ncbi:MAG TPA: amidohydrolase [Longimicrobiales bacterium]|nr:amidohydrolase [Longimicrobiales bacterium]